MYPIYKTICTYAYIHTHIDTLTYVYIHVCTHMHIHVCMYIHMCVCVCVPSHVQFFVTLWPEACQALLSMEFSRQEDWSGLPFSTPGDLPKPGIEPASLVTLALAGGFFTAAPHMDIHIHMHRTTRLHSYSKVNAFCNAMNCY